MKVYNKVTAFLYEVEYFLNKSSNILSSFFTWFLKLGKKLQTFVKLEIS